MMVASRRTPCLGGHCQAERFIEYPTKRELIDRKDQLIEKRATPPLHMQVTPAPAPHLVFTPEC